MYDRNKEPHGRGSAMSVVKGYIEVVFLAATDELELLNGIAYF